MEKGTEEGPYTKEAQKQETELTKTLTSGCARNTWKSGGILPVHARVFSPPPTPVRQLELNGVRGEGNLRREVRRVEMGTYTNVAQWAG